MANRVGDDALCVQSDAVVSAVDARSCRGEDQRQTRSFSRFPPHRCHCTVTDILEPPLPRKRTGSARGRCRSPRNSPLFREHHQRTVKGEHRLESGKPCACERPSLEVHERACVGPTHRRAPDGTRPRLHMPGASETRRQTSPGPRQKRIDIADGMSMIDRHPVYYFGGWDQLAHASAGPPLDAIENRMVGRRPQSWPCPTLQDYKTVSPE
jgi:hypothetical protein